MGRRAGIFAREREFPAATRYYNQVKPHVAMDTRKNICCNTTPITNQQSETAYQSVLTMIRGRAAAPRADLAAQ